MDPAASIELLARYGAVAALVFVTIAFVRGYVLPRGHHDEIVEAWRNRLSDADSRCRELARENTELRQALVLTNSQATRATGALAQVVSGNDRAS